MFLYVNGLSRDHNRLGIFIPRAIEMVGKPRREQVTGLTPILTDTITHNRSTVPNQVELIVGDSPESTSKRHGLALGDKAGVNYHELVHDEPRPVISPVNRPPNMEP
jgi:hypothetical protein